MSYKQPATSTTGVTHEKEHALIDARDFIWERGESITINLDTEETVERDKYGTIIKKPVTAGLSFYAFPVIFNPTDKQMEKAGIRERTGLIVYTAMQDWNDNDFDMETLHKLDSIRLTVVMDGAKYEIRDKNLHSQYSDTFLYVVLGLNRI